MEKLLKVAVSLVIVTCLLSLGLHGIPKDMVGLVAPGSLLLMVLSVAQQANSQKQMRADNLLLMQVQALIALIEDDRNKLDGMAESRRANGQKHPAFIHVDARYKRRLLELNSLVGQKLMLEPAESNNPEG